MMNSKEKDEYVNQTMERMTSMEPYYCNPFDNPKELKERASDLLKQLNSWGIMLRKKKKVLCGSCLELTISLHFRGMVLSAIMDLIFIFMDLQLSITTW